FNGGDRVPLKLLSHFGSACLFFFFQAEDGIRDGHVTGVQTCALPILAAETGIHIGDGGLSIKRGGPHGSYQYEVTGHALEDQLYLIGTVMPTISAAYNLQRPGFYINHERTWISLRYQNKAVALFKHEI